MKFSILVPVYNVEEYLVQCIESVLKQTYNNYELILVNDGSKDQSGTLCDQYATKCPDKIKVIHKENGGLISARRVGIQAATGDYCIFVDSDDYVEETLLETVAKYIQEESLDLLIYSFYYCRDGKIEPRKPLSVKHGTIWTKENKHDLYCRLIGSAELTSIWTKAIKTSILHADPTDYTQYYGKNMGEDLLQSLYPITTAEKIMFIDKPLYDYRINDDSISRSFRVQTIPGKNIMHVYEKIRMYLPIWGLENQETLDILHARWFNDTMYMLSKYYEHGQTDEDRVQVLAYDWNSLLPENAYNINNLLEKEDYKKLYVWLEEKDSEAIHRYFKQKQREQKIKKVKRVIKACLKRKKSHF